MQQIIDRLIERARAGTSTALEHARTLPPELYTNPDFFQRELEQVLRTEWISVGHVSQVPNPGDYFTYDLAGEPMVVVRDASGTLHALSAVCRHRWMPVVRGSGNARLFSCPYHKWAYELDGSFRGAPLMDRVAPLDPAACRLPSYGLELWNGWIFVNGDRDAPPLAPELADLDRLLAAWPMDELELVGPQEWDQAFNWKNLVDNFMEAYHHIGAHRETLQTILPAESSAVVLGETRWSMLRIPTRSGAPFPTLLPPFPGLDTEQQTTLWVVCVYPFHLFTVQPDLIVYYHLEIRDAERFQLRQYLLVGDGQAAAQPQAIEGMWKILDQVHREDIEACEGIQQGAASGRAEAGRYGHLEASLWHFHNWLLDRVAPQA